MRAMGWLALIEWVKEYQPLLWWLGGVSLFIFVGSLVVVPALIVRIPADYFALDDRPPSRWAHRSPLVRTAILVGKNLLGVVLLIAGAAMLVLPGQGLLTLLMGVVLVEFPGKYRFEQWLVSRRVVYVPINWLRRRAGRLPLLVGGGTKGT